MPQRRSKGLDVVYRDSKSNGGKVAQCNVRFAVLNVLIEQKKSRLHKLGL